MFIRDKMKYIFHDFFNKFPLEGRNLKEKIETISFE